MITKRRILGAAGAGALLVGIVGAAVPTSASISLSANTAAVPTRIAVGYQVRCIPLVNYDPNYVVNGCSLTSPDNDAQTLSGPLNLTVKATKSSLPIVLYCNETLYLNGVPVDGTTVTSKTVSTTGATKMVVPSVPAGDTALLSCDDGTGEIDGTSVVPHIPTLTLLATA